MKVYLYRMRLRALMEELLNVPDTWTVEPNQLRNMALLDDDGNYAGYVDLVSLDLVVFGDLENN